MSVLDYYLSRELGGYRELEEELEGTLLVTAHVVEDKDLIDFIKRRQRMFDRKYRQRIAGSSHFRNCFATDSLAIAYDMFMEILEMEPTPDQIREEATDILYRYVLFPDPEDCEGINGGEE